MAKLPLDEMSIEEKLQAMEMLWDDLCRRAESVSSPAWHGDLLADREAAVGRGEEVPEDWDAAKRKIRQDVP